MVTLLEQVTDFREMMNEEPIPMSRAADIEQVSSVVVDLFLELAEKGDVCANQAEVLKDDLVSLLRSVYKHGREAGLREMEDMVVQTVKRGRGP